MHPSQTRETSFNKDGEKHDQRDILESRDIRQVPNNRRVEAQSQNRVLLIRDVCTCLALRAYVDVPVIGACCDVTGAMWVAVEGCQWK